ncbi:MAG: JAB domain-containing protein [Oribacterium sp.]|nr:JAB domain-containing protein [Oribacterium sp.]
MAEEYELKQVKVRLKLAEADPIYSTEQITTPDKAAEVMAQVLSQMDREYCCVVNLDGANHPINFNVVSIGDVNQAHVPIQNVFKSAILSNAASIMMFHNHPSGSVKASREDIDVTKRLIEAGKIMNIPVLDHIIVGGGTKERFSFREESPEMFNVSESMSYVVREPRERLPIEGDSYAIYQLKDDDSLRYIRFEGLDRLQAEGNKVDPDNYNLVYEAELKPGTSLDDLYYQFNMQHPEDFRGHSMSVSDIVVLHQGDEDKAFYVDRFGFTEVPEFLLEKVEDLELDEAAYKLGDRYISIQRTEEGFDYSIFDEGYHLLDGGVLDDPDISMGEVLKQITDELKQPVYDAEHDRYIHTELQGNIRQKDMPVAVDYDELMEKTDTIGQEEIQAVRSEQEIVADFRAKTEEKFDAKALDGMGPAVIEEAVRERVLQIAEDYGLDVTVEDVIVSGSRCRGLENADSDLDVVVSYSGGEREDDFFNVLHDERMLFGTVELDINPINTEETGTLAQYLPGVEKYLTEKAAQIEQSKAIEAAEKEKQRQVVTFTVAESSEFHSFGELHEGIPRLEDALKVYEQLCEKSNLNGIPAVGINVHTVGTPAYEDMQSDFLSGKRLDLDALMYLPEMSQNEEVMEALHGMKEAYPDVEVIGRFPDEQQDLTTSGPTVQKSEELTAQSLAEQLNQFAYDYDLYEYRDSVEDPEAHIAMLKNDIENGTTEGITSYLQEIVDQEDGLPEDLEKAKELLAKLAEYKPLAKVEEREEQNYNMIDNVLNNLPQDPEEKKEPAPQKEMRMAEVKKVRKRVSMKKLLAEKKVEVAEREKKPPEVGAPSKRPSMGVDD